MATDRHHTRREFLHGKATADALQNAVSDCVEPISARIAEAERSFLLSLRRRLMACDFEVQLPADRHDHASEHAVAALDLIEALEAQMTVYRDDSEVQHINRTAAEQPVAVEPRLFQLIQLAERLYQETGGAHDATSGPLSKVWGFSRRQGRLPDDVEIEVALARTGFDHVQIDEQRCKISFRRPGINLNLNSIGKGYALDRAAELLTDSGVEDFLFHGGRSSVLARGGPAGSRSGWTIGLRHPLRPQERMAEFLLRDESLSTSGSGTQYFRHQGRRYGHILDPRTGQPAAGIYSATAIAPTAAEADALSTAFYVMGPPEVADYCATRPTIKALLVCPTGREGSVQFHPFNLDDDSWTCHESQRFRTGGTKG